MNQDLRNILLADCHDLQNEADMLERTARTHTKNSFSHYLKNAEESIRKIRATATKMGVLVE